MGEENTEHRMSEMMENEASDLTEYERERLERVRRNRDMLANLHVQEIATAFEAVPKKARGQSSKGKEKVEVVYPRRTTRLSTCTKTPTKIVDWSSGESDAEAPSESDLDGIRPSKRSAKTRKKKKDSSAEEGLSEDEIPRKKQDDDEYEPSGASDSDPEGEEADEPEDDQPLQQSGKKQRGKNGRSPGRKADFEKFSFRLKPLKPRSSLAVSSKEEDSDGHDPDLQQAIQLSMQKEESREPSSKSPGAKGAGASKQRKRKAGRDLKFTQSEVDAYFVSIAGSDSGAISLKLLENAALSLDFIWSEEELQDMIDVFDENDDGFLSLQEFRAMAARCKLMEAT